MDQSCLVPLDQLRSRRQLEEAAASNELAVEAYLEARSSHATSRPSTWKPFSTAGFSL
jgi:hypothetical protein